MPSIKKFILGFVFAATAGFSFGAGQIHARLKTIDGYPSGLSYITPLNEYAGTRLRHSPRKEMNALSGYEPYKDSPENYPKIKIEKKLASLNVIPLLNYPEGPLVLPREELTIENILARFEDTAPIQAAETPTVSPKTIDDILASLEQPGSLPALVIPTISPNKPFANGKLKASLQENITPSVPKARKVSPKNYNVFRSVVIPVGKMAAFDQWSRIAPVAHITDACADSLCKTSTGKRLAAAAKKADSLAPVEALRLINSVVNRTIKYRSDRGDHWASVAESAARGYGDCEDYAIAKMQLLNRIGFTPEQLQFVVLKDTRRGLYHAVLAVHVDGKNYVLDNLSNTIASDTLFRSYMPIASFAGAKSFIHGFTGRNSSVASLGKGGFAAISLGGKT
ncbi:MAG: hypothetical protein COB78_13425 [Hyphomicrobiales bacterium]|nr:MAG: hypothetical protein COB78_13425 [Hyphomicrobiales bacterium]